ncbi:MAG: VCBS repeat-containing protein [Planctomycetes bacterium]|nr:VCBS repeat-containing protein [Planctomycetota bacterium]
MRSALLLLIGAAALADPAWGAGPGPFRVIDFGPSGRITSTIYDDLDGDGRCEILLFYGHRIAVHVADEAGNFAPEPARVVELPADALAFCLGQLDEDFRTRELAVVIPAGVLAYRSPGGDWLSKTRTLVASENLVTGGEPDAVHWRGFVRDLDGDGLDDLLLATGLGFGVYYQQWQDGGEGGSRRPGRWPERPDRLLPYSLASAVSADPAGLTGTFRGEIGVPDVLLADFDGDGRADVGLDDGRTIRVFTAGEDGRVLSEASMAIDLSPLAGPDGAIPRFFVKDLTGDGRPELLVSRRTEGITDLYLSTGDIAAPALRIKIPGWSFEPRFADLDGDGHPDLVIPVTPEFGPTTIMSVAVTGSVGVLNHVFLNTGDAAAPFRKTPDHVREVRVRIVPYIDSAGNVRATHTVLVNFEADFDGDGRKDLLLREGADEVRIFPGTADGLFRTEPALSVRIPDPADATGLESLVADLNGDGRLDVALFYESHSRTMDRLVLLLAEKGE